MKAKITGVRYVKEFTGKDNTPSHIFGISYDGKEATYFCKSKDQTKFVEDVEAEFTETISDYRGEEQIKIKPVSSYGNSNYGRAVKKEQSRYSGFAMSYAKDLVVAGIVDINDMSIYTRKMFTLMVELDKTLQS